MKHLFLLLICQLYLLHAIGQKVFSSPDDCFRYAVSHNTQLAVAARQVKLQENNLQRAWYSLLPQVNLYSTLDYNYELPVQLLPAEVIGGQPGQLIPVQFGTRYALTGTAEAKAPLISVAKWKEIGVSKREVAEAGMALQDSRETLHRQLITAWYQLLLANKSLLIAEEQQLLADSLATVATTRLKAEVLGPVEYQRSRQLALDAALTRQQQTSTCQLRLNDLRELLQLSPSDTVIINDSLPVGAPDIHADMFRATASTAALRSTLHQQVQYARWQQERSRLLPEVSLYARYGKMAQRNSFDFTSSDGTWFGMGLAGVRIDIPLFQLTSQRSAVRDARIRYEISTMETAHTTLKEEIRWDNWYKQYAQTKASLPDAQESAALALDNYQKTLLQFNTGIIGIDPVIERYKDVLQAQWKAQQLRIELYQLYILLQTHANVQQS